MALSVAGGSGRRFGDGPIHTVTAEAWDATLGLNLRTQILACARVVRVCATRRRTRRGRAGRLLLASVLATVPVAGALRDARLRRGQGRPDRADDDHGRDLRADRIRVNPVAPVAHRHADGRPRGQRTRTSSTTPHGSSRWPARCWTRTRSRTPPSTSCPTTRRAVTGQSLAVDGGWSVISTHRGAASA